MPSSPIAPTAATATAAVLSGDTTHITAIHPDIIQSHILNRLDGATLASTSCASAQLFSLCKDDHLWRRICNSTWPSTADPLLRDIISAFPSGHRSFYSDAFPAVRLHEYSNRVTRKRSSATVVHVPVTPELISAVDVYCDDKLIYSKVIVTETLSGWFNSSPFRFDLLHPKETIPTPLMFDGEDANRSEIESGRLRVNWILVDPTRKRAVNVASLKVVEAQRHWLTEDLQLRFATVAPGGSGEMVQYAVMVTCGGKEGGQLMVREVGMQVEDIEGKIVCGKDGLSILQETMAAQRCRGDGRTEKEMFEMFLAMKIQSRERKQRMDRSLDMAVVAADVCSFIVLCIFFLCR